MSDRNIKITLQYDGSRYDGWQKQGNTDKTIQGKLEQILEKMAGQTIEVHGSGRTAAERMQECMRWDRWRISIFRRPVPG